MGLIMQEESQYLSPEQVAAELGVKVGTLAVWRSRGDRGPAFHRFGAVIRYYRPDLDAWKAARRVATAAPTPQPERQALQAPAAMPAWLQATRAKAAITSG